MAFHKRWSGSSDYSTSTFECSIIMDNSLSEWFPVDSGVRQGCILSSILFLITIDWIMRKTTSDRPRGIQWTLFKHLEDLDFADDLALLSSKNTHLQDKSDRMNSYAKQTGLNINKKKSQVMHINTKLPIQPISIDGDELKSVEDFTYLRSLVSKDNGAKKDITVARSADSVPSGSQNNTARRPRSSSTTAMSSLFCCTVLNAGA